MACSNCNTPNCGCSGTYVVSQTCPPACSEVFNSACIVYTGVDIICNDTTVSPAVPTTIVRRNDYLDTALTAIVQYVCSRFNTQIHPTTVVDSGDAFIVVSSNVVGAETTYTVSLDPTNLPQASEVTGGVNVTVTGDGTPTTDPYVVNAQGTIVAVAPGTALSVIADADTPGPFDTTYTIDIDYDQLPDVSLITSQGYISITEQAGVPNAGDTQYTLDVDQVTVTAADVRLTSTETAAGGAPNFLRTFDIALDEAEMSTWIMNSVVWNTDPLTDAGLIAGTGIAFAFDPVLSQIEISSVFTDPERWDELSDFAGTTIQPNLPTSTLAFLANPATVDAGGDGISAVLGGIPSAAEVQFTNTDPGSAQLIFGSVEVSGQPTITADSNTEVLTIVAGVDIEVTTDNTSKALTITNGINAVYSNIEGDDSVSLQAGSTTDTLDILGGDGITTSGNAAGPGNNQLTITNDGVLGVTSSSADIVVDNTDSQNPIITTTLNVRRGDDITGIGYVLGDPLTTISHNLGEQYIVARAFNGTEDVTSSTRFFMPNANDVQISNGSNDIDRLVILY